MARNVFVPVSRQGKRYVYELQNAYPFELTGDRINAIRFSKVSPNTGLVSTFGAIIIGGIELQGEIIQGESVVTGIHGYARTMISKGGDE